jgi:hypothetical protein
MRLSASAAVAPVMAVAIVATGLGGVTVAATASKGVKACETSKGVLAIASSAGSCSRHDKKVTLGARGARGAVGAKGATGPSNGYVDTTRFSSSLSTSGTEILSVALPAGSYVLSGDIGLSSTDTGAAQNVACEFATGGTNSLTSYAVAPAATPDGQFIEVTNVSVALASAVTLPSSASVTVTCLGSTMVEGSGTMTAVKVGTLAASGDPAFF